MNRDDVEIIEHDIPYDGYFRIERFQLRHRRFDGDWMPVFTRELFERGRAVAVLPYDPRRDEVVLIRQFRIGAWAAGLETPWLWEIVAGIVEDGETDVDVLHRETMEEAGLELGRIEPVSDYLVSPGGTSERCTAYCAEVDAGAAGGVHGLDQEHEDIAVERVPFDRLQAMLATGELCNAVAVISTQWLMLNRDRLRREWVG
jgi:ADP-ribose pyrophosphatase